MKLQKTLRISAQAPSLVQQFEYDYHAWYILHTRVLTIGTALGKQFRLPAYPSLQLLYFGKVVNHSWASKPLVVHR